MTFLVLDLEAIPAADCPAPAEPPSPDGRERLPPPAHFEVVCIGALLFDGYEFKRLGILAEGKGEAGILTAFSSYLDHEEPTLVTWNGRRFDMPVIVARCLRHGIPLPTYYNWRDVRYRYSAEGHFDLKDFLSDYGAGHAMSLDAAAKLCGMPGKLGITGDDVAGMVADGKLAEVQRYCLSDVTQTAAVFLRTELLRGNLNRSHYLEAMGLLVEWVRWDLRLAPVAEAMNVERLMLRETS